MINVLIDTGVPFIRGVLEAAGCAVRYARGSTLTNADLRDVDVIVIRTSTICTPELLAGTAVKLIATTTIGFNHIDIAYCAAHGIKWVNAPGCNAGGVQNYIGGALAYLNRVCNVPLKGKTLGVIGVGHTGTLSAQLGNFLGMKVLLNDPPRAEKEKGFVDLVTLQKEADIITFHVPLTRVGPHATYHLGNDDFFSSLKPGVTLINASRGEVIDTHAFCAALRAKRLAQAIVDVWENEPVISQELLNLCTLGTMHIAGYTADGKYNGARAALEAIEAHFGLHLDYSLMGELPPFAYEKALSDAHNRIDQLRACYPIEQDDQILRAHVADFDELRATYHYRRDIPQRVFTAPLNGCE